MSVGGSRSSKLPRRNDADFETGRGPKDYSVETGAASFLSRGRRMKFTIECKTIRELIAAAGVPVGVLAKRLGLSDSMTSQKATGERPFFADEIGAVAAAINEAGRVKVTNKQVIELIGKANIKRRGTLAETA